MSILERALRIGERKLYRRFERNVGRINDLEEQVRPLSDGELRERYEQLRRRHIEGGESLDDLLFECFALTREAARRTLGQRHYDVQLIGGMVLHAGAIAEMKTGEGKTLTATLAVALNALASRDQEGKPRQGKGVHVVTVNDYLARRDAEWMGPIYRMLGITVGVIQSGQPEYEKRAAYECDVTYGTNSEFGFDYLRDNLAIEREQKVQRGHGYAIVDEVDNILIDEARTPLIISGRPEQAADLYYKFAKLAKIMEPGKKPDTFEAKSKHWVADFDYEPDEKHKTVSITERGVEKAEKFLGIDNLFRPENGYLVNHLIQALKAESLYKRDKDYAVIDGQVKIIDEFTGRILEGRRWSEGLHQAIEAKEGVPIQEESQTVATITYQNYFRKYEKLAGMTGTALTEAVEFKKIYNLDVVEIPTHRPMIRVDHDDRIYKTKEGKWKAVLREIEERHRKGQPVLVGTISVEVSEMLSNRLKKLGIPHVVLNAKPEHAAREADIIAEAGRPGAVTIATNMAGRGVDIKLGGNEEHLTTKELEKRGLEPGTPEWEKAWEEVYPRIREQVERDRERVKELGGLFILGTERHEARRIDNQLRGRAGRQGDPGESRFYLSAEDDLVRLFAGDRIYKILDRLGPVDEHGEEQPIEARILSKQIENAQRKVEEQNFLIRKRVLEYDDVMNQQREVIYEYRDRILEGEDLSETVREQLADVVERIAREYLASDIPEEWDIEALFDRLVDIYPCGYSAEDVDLAREDRESLIAKLREDVVEAYEEREKELGSELLRALERFLLLQIIDERWREHLHDMDYLREGIHLRGFAQIDPLVAYKNEAFEMFGQLMNSIWDEFARQIFNVEVEVQPEQPQGPVWRTGANTTSTAGRLQYSGGHAAQGRAAIAQAAAGAGAEALALDEEPPPEAPVVETRRVDEREKIGRNDPCWCGSGKKFKKCHGRSV
ncbi:preprotein translocase subunit SecA [Thermoleophilum album]|uniref:preprotein translocase subunit SecA n=1 Tax=Thermoleophilum album TaxID=29539 RepID=UPI00237C94CD|nr:preprotein translocase subunit SecA [Thermoleophilum album]WDT94625.1 preprotein translocase subunit SecA [Thermoleophilum album]